MGVDATSSFNFEKQEDKTKVTMTGIVQGHWFGLLMAPILKKAMEKADDKVLENLKQVIEKNKKEIQQTNPRVFAAGQVHSR